MNFFVAIGLLAVVTFRVDATTDDSHPTAAAAAATAADAVTAASADGADPSSKKFKEYIDLKLKQRSGVVTIEFDDVATDDVATESHKKFPGVIVAILNSATPTESYGKIHRRRRDVGKYSEDGILLVDIKPAVLSNRLRISFAAQSEGAGIVLRATVLEQILKNSTGEIKSHMNLTVYSVYVGLPQDVREALAEAFRRPTVWEVHWMMFIVVAAVIAIAIVIVIICLLCFYCCPDEQSPAHAKVELSPNKQTPVQDMIEVTPVVPLQYAPVSQQNPTTTEPSPTIEEENGWIVPIDQLSPEELEQPDIQISKL